MKRNIILPSAHALALLVLVCMTAGIQAAGTTAGTVIVNSATLDYIQGGTPLQTSTNTDTITVQELIDVVTVWQDAASIQVLSPDTDRVLTYMVRNTGNGIETFALGIDNSPPTGDDDDPVNPRIHIDGNGNGSFDGPAIDPLYVPGSNDPVLDANGNDSAVIFVLNDIQPGGVNGETCDSQLQVLSTTAGAAGAAAATLLPGAGDGGMDAIVGSSNADADDIGTYQILNTPLDVAITKSALVINDGYTCNTPPCSPVPGATIRYTLQVDVTGSGVAGNLVITDSIPADTTYVPASITLDTTPLTDGIDADAGNFSGGMTTVYLGAVSAPATHIITFDVTID